MRRSFLVKQKSQHRTFAPHHRHRLSAATRTPFSQGDVTDSRMQFAVDLSGYMAVRPTSAALSRMSNFTKSDQHNPVSVVFKVG